MSHQSLQLEQFGGTPEVKPEIRYGQIHRDLEKGLNSERLWIELVEVCLQLGKVGEAAKGLAHVYTPQEATRLTRMFESRGVVFAGNSGAPGMLGDVSGVDPQALGAAEQQGPSKAAAHPGQKPAKKIAVAPRSPHARAKAAAPQPEPAHVVQARAELERESVMEQFQDAVGYLFVDHMPIAAIGLTLLFPALASVFFLLPAEFGLVARTAMTSLPALLCLGVVLHVGMRVLQASAEGEEDPPSLLHGVMGGAPRALAGFTVAAAICFLPAVALSMTAAPSYPVLVLFVLGASYFPMALLGMTMRQSLSGAAPRRVLSAMAQSRGAYLKVVMIVFSAFVLPAAVILSLLGRSIFLQAAVTGPLLVGPCLVLARMLGRFWYVRSTRLAESFGVTIAVQKLATVHESARLAAGRERQAARQERERSERESASAQMRRAQARGNRPEPRQPAAKQGPARQQRQVERTSAATQVRSGGRQSVNEPQRPRGAWRASPRGQAVAVGASKTSNAPAQQLNQHRHTPLRRRH